MGLVRTWRRQIYGASLVAVLIPAAIIGVLFAVTGGVPLHGLGALGQVFSGPAIPGGNLSANVVTSSKPALPGKGTVGAAALRGHSPLVGVTHAATSPAAHGPTVTPLRPGSGTPASNGGALHGGTGAVHGTGGTPPGNHPPPPPPPPATTTTTTTTTTSNTTTAASLPPIVAVPPPTETTTTTETSPTSTSTTPTTTTRTTTTTTTTRTTTTRTTTTRTTTTPTTKTTTTTRTVTTPAKPPPRTGAEVTTSNLVVTVAQARHGPSRFSQCDGDWGVAPTGHVVVPSAAGSSHAAANGGTSTVGEPSGRRP